MLTELLVYTTAVIFFCSKLKLCSWLQDHDDVRKSMADVLQQNALLERAFLQESARVSIRVRVSVRARVRVRVRVRFRVRFRGWYRSMETALHRKIEFSPNARHPNSQRKAWRHFFHYHDLSMA